jgi:uncharacterized membrane protein
LFLQHYQPPAGSALANAKCMICHTSPNGGERNPYGKDLEAQITAANADDLTVPMIVAIENKDSDGDGFSNIEEIKAGALPGDPTSHPAGSQPSAGQGHPSPGAGETLWQKLFPSHSYHPAIVHFPIALLIFGALVDVFGFRRKRKDVRLLARWNLVAGALFTLPAVATGLTAMFRNGFSFAGTVLIHFCVAVSSALLALAVAYWHRKSMPSNPAYWALLALMALGISIAGFFGGEIAYG